MPDPCQFIVNLQDGLVEENVQKAKGELEEALVKFETWIENTLSNYGKDVSYIATFADEYCTKLKDASLETLANEQLESMWVFRVVFIDNWTIVTYNITLETLHVFYFI